MLKSKRILLFLLVFFVAIAAMIFYFLRKPQPTVPTLVINQYEMVDKVIINPILSYTDEPTNLTFTFKPAFFSTIQEAQVAVWSGKLNKSITIPSITSTNAIIATVTSAQKNDLERSNNFQIILTINGQKIRPAHFNGTFEILPYKKGELVTIESGDVTVIGPPGYDSVFKKIAENNKLCYDLTQKYFGRPLPAGTLFVYNQLRQQPSASAGTVTVNNFLNDDFIESYKTTPVQCDKTTLHEIIHVYLAGTVAPGWMHEGLAETVSQRLTKGLPGTFDEKLNCQSGYWTIFGEEKHNPYIVMDQPGLLPQSEWYYATPRCYLKYLEEQSDATAEKKIIERLIAKRDEGFRNNSWCSKDYQSFLREILVPIFGEKIIDTSVNRFGIKDYSC